MFRRSSSSTDQTPSPTAKPDGKGRPTPTRKQAEAAARERAKVPRTRREQAAAQRRLAGSSLSSKEVRERMKAGEEAYLLPRDQGPVRRFIREYVDARFSFAELLLPILFVSMVLGYSGSTRLISLGNSLLLTGIAVFLVDVVVLRLRLNRELAARFPGEETGRTTWYAVSRAMQIRFLRMPKTGVKIGDTLPAAPRK